MAHHPARIHTAQAQAYAINAIASGIYAATNSAGRRSLLQTTYDLSDIATLRSLVQDAAAAMQAAGASALGTGVADPALVTAAVTAVSNLQTTITGLTDGVQLMQAVYVGSSTVSGLLTDLATGAITPAALAASTTAAALLQAATTTALPGQVVPNPCIGGQVPVWSSSCLSPDPFSCTNGAGAVVTPGSQCVLPPNWDIRVAQLTFAFQWDLASISAQATGSYFTLYQFQLGQALPDGYWGVQFLRSPYVPALLEFGHTGAVADVVTATTSSVTVSSATTYLTVSFQPGAGVLSESGAIVVRYLGALRPSPNVVACAPTQSALIYSSCLDTNGNSPATCGPNTYNTCVNSPNLNTATNSLAFSTQFGTRWDRPPPMFWSPAYATIYKYPVNQLPPGLYHLQLLASSLIGVTVTLERPNGAAPLVFTSTTTTAVIPVGGVLTVTVSFLLSTQADNQSSGFTLTYVSPLPSPPPPNPPATTTVSTNSFTVTLSVPPTTSTNVNALSNLVTALQSAFATYFGVPTNNIVISAVQFVSSGPTPSAGRRRQQQQQQLVQPLAMLPAPPTPPAPPSTPSTLQVLVQLVAPIDALSDPDAQDRINAALAQVALDPTLAITPEVTTAFNITNSAIDPLAQPPSPPVVPPTPGGGAYPPVSVYPPSPRPYPPSPAPSPPAPSPTPPSPPIAPYPPPASPPPPPPGTPVAVSPSPAPSSSSSPSPSAITNAPPGGGSTPNSGPSASASGSSSDNKASVIVPAVVVPVAVVGIGAAVAGWYFMSKRKAAYATDAPAPVA